MEGESGAAEEAVELLWPIEGQGRNTLRALWPEAAAFIAPGRTKAATARHVGCHPSTVAKWCKDPGFLKLVRRAQEEHERQAVKAAVRRDIARDDDSVAGTSGRKRHENQKPRSFADQIKKHEAGTA